MLSYCSMDTVLCPLFQLAKNLKIHIQADMPSYAQLLHIFRNIPKHILRVRIEYVLMCGRITCKYQWLLINIFFLFLLHGSEFCTTHSWILVEILWYPNMCFKYPQRRGSEILELSKPHVQSHFMDITYLTVISKFKKLKGLNPLCTWRQRETG